MRVVRRSNRMPAIQRQEHYAWRHYALSLYKGPTCHMPDIRAFSFNETPLLCKTCGLFLEREVNFSSCPAACAPNVFALL